MAEIQSTCIEEDLPRYKRYCSKHKYHGRDTKHMSKGRPAPAQTLPNKSLLKLLPGHRAAGGRKEVVVKGNSESLQEKSDN